MRNEVSILNERGVPRVTATSVSLIESITCNTVSAKFPYYVSFALGSENDEINRLNEYGFRYVENEGSLEDLAKEFGFVLLPVKDSQNGANDKTVAFNPLCIQRDSIVACEDGVTIGSNDLIVPLADRVLILAKFQPHWDRIAAEQAAENAPAGPSDLGM